MDCLARLVLLGAVDAWWASRPVSSSPSDCLVTDIPKNRK